LRSIRKLRTCFEVFIGEEVRIFTHKVTLQLDVIDFQIARCVWGKGIPQKFCPLFFFTTGSNEISILLLPSIVLPSIFGTKCIDYRKLSTNLGVTSGNFESNRRISHDIFHLLSAL
jgi:hypothetical protein